MFAVVDTETTGLDPRRGHRIIELAVVRVGSELDVEDEWDSLLNPDRNVGASAIHGIHFADVENAPRFADIAGDVLDLLGGEILVTHNRRFDVAFLAAEFRRVGYAFKPDALCTLELAEELGLPSRLRDCCERLGVPCELGHAASVDARAVACVLPQLLEEASEAGLPLRFAPCGHPHTALARSGQRLPRAEPFRTDTQTFVSSLIGALPATPTGGVHHPTHAASAYADLLDRVLADRVITTEERESLAEFAKEWGLRPDQLADIHHSYVTALVAVALSDGMFTRPEQDDVGRVARLLDVDHDDLDSILAGANAIAQHGLARTRASGFGSQFAGKTVYFASRIGCSIHGRSIGDNEAPLLAAAAGLITAQRLSPAVDIVVTDPERPDEEVEEARRYGIEVIAERVFWATIGVGID
jgi:DNA polymerase-3 subunit epsilon